jgi:outer membrane protein TolC
MSLQDVIQMALEHNLDVQIVRFNPIVDQFALSGAYGAYDPTFSLSARQDYGAFLGGFNAATGLSAPPNETWQETFDAGLAGVLPTGLTYDIGGNLRRTSGTTSFFDTNNVAVTRDRGFQYNAFTGIQLSQPLLKNFWIDATRQQIWVNKKVLKMDELGVKQQIITTVTQVELAYYELIFAFENVRVQEKAMELAERLLAENRKRVEVGALAPLDEKQAESQVAASRADLLVAQRNLEAQQNALKNLITDTYGEWHPIRIEPSEPLVPQPHIFNLQESWQLGLTQRPDLQQGRVDLERRDIILRYQRNQLYPQLDLVGSYGRNGLGVTTEAALADIRDEKAPSFSYGAIFSIPLSNRTARNNYRATQALKRQALLTLKRLEQNIMVQIDDAIKLAQTDIQRVEATRQASLYAAAALEAEQKKLENGKSTSFQVLQLQRDLTARRSEEIRALADYNRALAQLAQAEGTTLERNKLKVEFR